MDRIYVCCPHRDCGGHAAAVEFLEQWKVPYQVGVEAGEHYLEIDRSVLGGRLRTAFDQALAERVKPEEAEADRESELAEALEAYTDPNHPEYDPEFTAEMRRLRPDWFDGPRERTG